MRDHCDREISEDTDVTILLAREDFGIEANVTSDCAPLGQCKSSDGCNT